MQFFFLSVFKIFEKNLKKNKLGLSCAKLRWSKASQQAPLAYDSNFVCHLRLVKHDTLQMHTFKYWFFSYLGKKHMIFKILVPTPLN